MQVVCGSCHSYSGHLFEVLGADLGIFDGMTMKEKFCEELLSACEGQLKFPRYSGNTDYCPKHVGGTKDRFWSYPYTEREYDRSIPSIVLKSYEVYVSNAEHSCWISKLREVRFVVPCGQSQCHIKCSRWINYSNIPHNIRQTSSIR